MTEQRTEQWFKQRQGRITGSRIGAILGLSPWQKPDDIMRAMVREYHGHSSEFAGNIATEHGNSNEQRALLAFMRATGLQVEQCGFFEYGDRMGASPDGLTSDGGTLELKVPFSLRNGGTFKTLAEQPHYGAQVQMEMLAAGRKHAYFAQYIAPKGDPLAPDYVQEQIKIERVELDESWIDSVLPKINEFYRQYLLELYNPEHLEPLRDVRTDSEAIEKMMALIDAREALEQAKAQVDALTSEIIELCDNKNAEILGRKITLVKRKGSVSYAKAFKELMPDADLEPYRGEDTEFWRVG